MSASPPAAETPRPLARRVAERALRLLTILAVAFAAWTFWSSSRGLLHSTTLPELPPDPRQVRPIMPAAFDAQLPGSWTLGDATWAVGFKPDPGRLDGLGSEPPGSASELERGALAWVANMAVPQVRDGVSIYTLPAGGATIRLVATGPPPLGRVRLVQLVMGGAAGGPNLLEIAPQSGGQAADGAMLGPVADAQQLARRSGADGRLVAELYRAPFDAAEWRTRLGANGWQARDAGPAALAVTRGGVTVRGFELGHAPNGTLWLFAADPEPPTGAASP